MNLPKSTEKPTLYVHEWLALAVILGMLGMLTAVSLMSTPSPLPETGTPHAVIDPYIEVEVKGAVENPGSMRIKRGTLVGEVIALAKPLPEANLSRIRAKSKARKGQIIDIPERKKKNLRKKNEGKRQAPLECGD